MSEESDFSDDSPIGWIQWFCSLQDHQFFCQISEDFIRQPFNLYGLSKKVKNYNKCLQMILRSRAPAEDQIQDPQFLQLYQEAIQLYGLIHSRFIATPEGLSIMREKYLAGKFGNCPRVLCQKQNVIPIGISQDSKIARVKVYCPRCKDIYVPKKKPADVDGSYFGTSFPHLLLMTYPDVGPIFPRQNYQPTIFGFKIEQRRTEGPTDGQVAKRQQNQQSQLSQQKKKQQQQNKDESRFQYQQSQKTINQTNKKNKKKNKNKQKQLIE